MNSESDERYEPDERLDSLKRRLWRDRVMVEFGRQGIPREALEDVARRIVEAGPSFDVRQALYVEIAAELGVEP